jgi:hypothetical protein
MRGLVGTLLLTCCFTLGVIVEPRLAYTQVYARHDKGPVEVVLGDARRLFAGYFFAKADVYFHSGYYPSIFDEAGKGESHIATDAGASEQKHEGEVDFMGKPRDWIDKFSRSFYPSTHTHLDSGGGEHKCEGHDHAGHDHAKHKAESGGAIREILPWLSMAAELDPNRIETYTVGAFWLRTRLNMPKEAEAFLREGLRQNRGSYAILFELGRIFHESYKDPTRARNVLEYALIRWDEQEASKPEPDTFLLSQITWQLALIEREGGNGTKAISYLQIAKRVSPTPAEVEKRIAEIQAEL